MALFGPAPRASLGPTFLLTCLLDDWLPDSNALSDRFAPLAKKLELLLKRSDAPPPFATQYLTRVRERSSAVLILRLTWLDW